MCIFKKEIGLALFLLSIVSTVFSHPSLVHAVSGDIAINATVAPLISAFSLNLSTDGPTNVSQQTSIPIKIIYGSSLTTASPLTIQAYWGKGIINTDAQTQVDILEYSEGSATPGYANTIPVIDLVNKTVTWSIPSLPGNTNNQAVTFTLTTTTAYTGAKTVSFPISTQFILPSVGGNTSLTRTYTYVAPPTTPAPSTTPTPSPTAADIVKTATQSSVVAVRSPPSLPLTISPLILSSVSNTSMNLSLQSSRPITARLFYGTSLAKIESRQANPNPGTLQTFSVTALIPQTRYFFRVVATDIETGSVVRSDVFTYKTATQPIADLYVIPDTVTISAGGTQLSSSEQPQKDALGQISTTIQNQKVVLPQQATFDINFTAVDPKIVKSIELFVGNHAVLGFSTLFDSNSDDQNAQNATMTQTSPGHYYAKLRAPNTAGSYDVIARTTDIYGNIKEQLVTQFHILPPMKIISSNGKPIENARVYIEKLDPNTNTYGPLPGAAGVSNPSYTAPDGSVRFALTAGSFRAQVSSIGYKDAQIDFIVNGDNTTAYPIIKLIREPFSLQTASTYYWKILADLFDASRTYVTQLSHSVRFFELNALVAITILVILTIAGFSSRIHIPIHSLYEYAVHHVAIQQVKKKTGNTIFGHVFEDTSGHPVKEADIFLLSENSKRIVAHTTSSAAGAFAFQTIPDKGYEIEVLQQNFEPITYRQSEIQSVGLGGYLLTLKKAKLHRSIKEYIDTYVHKVLALSFETLLVISLTFELSLGSVLGWAKVAPFFLISTLNILLWLVHMSHMKSETKEA